MKVARNRSFFTDAILTIKEGLGQPQHYKFLYAVMSPGYIALSPLDELPPATPGQAVPSWSTVDSINERRV
eukprot:3326991-Lingulodinium_polyedra.AAC.1